MNSWMSTLLSAWAPPLRMFIIGTGSTWAFGPPRYRNRRRLADSAAAWATAMLTPTMALAPSRDLSGVPSRSIMVWSISRWSSASKPSNSSWISPLTWPTALVTPLPPNSSPPSRSSTASKAPVEAPLGTPARAIVPSSRATSTSRVGLPLESRICLPYIELIEATAGSSCPVQECVRYQSVFEPGGARGPAAPATPASGRPSRRRVRLLPGPDPVLVTAGRGPQFQLRIQVGGPGRRDQGEQLVTEAFRGLAAGSALGQQVVGHPGPAGPALQLADQGQARLPERHAVQGRGRLAGRRGLGGPFRLLDLVPVQGHVVRPGHGHVGEHVRVPADQLGHDPVGHIVDGVPGAVVPLGGHLGVEQHLQQHVPEFFAERAVVAVLQRLQRLVGLFEQVRRERGGGLLGVPRALLA